MTDRRIFRVEFVHDGQELAAEVGRPEPRTGEIVLPFLADAIAIALGYTSHPNEDAEQPLVKQPQPRPVRIHGIAAVPSRAC